MDVQFIELGELGMGHVAGSQGEQVFVPDPVGFVGDLAETILDGGFRGEHTQLFLGERRILVGGLRGKQEIGFLSVFRLGLRLVFDAARVEDVGDVDFEDKREARDANVFKRGRLLRNAEQVAGEQSEKLRGAVPWLEDTNIPSDWDQANRFRMRATKAIHDHDMQPRTGLVDELERRLEQAERAEGEKPSPEQVKALALRMAEQRERAAEDPTQDMNRPEPSGDEPLDLSEPEDLGESGPFEERSAPRTKADLLREIRQRADRRTGQQEAEQRQIDPWQVQPPQRRGHGR